MKKKTMEFFFDKFKNNICIRSLARRNTYPLAKLGECNFEATSQNGEIREREREREKTFPTLWLRLMSLLFSLLSTSQG